jgi:hypothetical protein
MTINELANIHPKKIIMSIHFICGIYCMIMFCIQKLIVGMKFHRYTTMNLIHISLVLTVYLASIILAASGIWYIHDYGTIGGIFMDTCFYMYGFLMLFTTLACIIVAYGINIKHPLLQNHSSKFITAYLTDESIVHADNLRLKNLIKKYHILNNIHGSLIFGAMFYRILYIYAANIQYPLPVTHNDYNRTMDLIFQVVFFIIPMIAIVIYSGFSNKKFKKVRDVLRLILIALLTSTVVSIIILYS